MGQSYYKVSGVLATLKSGDSSKENHNRQQKDQKKENEKTFKMECEHEVTGRRTVSTLWGIYNLFCKGEIKSEELTGSTIYDLFTVLMKEQKEVDSSLLERYQSLQNGEGISRFTEESPKMTRKLNLKNYEKYNSLDKNEKE